MKVCSATWYMGPLCERGPCPALLCAAVRRTGTCTAILLTEHWLLTAAHCYTMRGRSESNPYLTDVSILCTA